MENKFLNFNGWGEIIGVVFAGLIILAGIAGGVYLLLNDKPLGGFTAMLTPLAGVAIAFVKARASQAAEKARKR